MPKTAVLPNLRLANGVSLFILNGDLFSIFVLIRDYNPLSWDGFLNGTSLCSFSLNYLTQNIDEVNYSL